MLTDNNLKQFERSLRSKVACFDYLIKQKWPNGFVCRRCGNSKYYRGKSQFHRRCSKCKYDESPTANTLFHKLKFPINKAFSIIFDLLNNPEGYSSCALSRSYALQQSTTWLFRRKVAQGMTRLHTCSFKVTESGNGLQQKGLNLNKLLLTEAALGAGINLDLYSRLHPFEGYYFAEAARFNSVPSCIVLSDHELMEKKVIHSKARGNAWLLSLMPLSGENVEMKADFLCGFTNWIRCTHRHVSPKHLFYYCGEYAYRFFNIQSNSRGFPRLIQAIILHPKLQYKQLKET